MKITEHKKGVYSLVYLALVYASMGLFVRYLATSFEIFQQIYLRIFAAFVIALIVFNRKLDFSKLLKISVKEWGLISLRAFCFYILGVNLYTRALLLTKYSNVSFIGSLPITALFGFLLFKEKLGLKKILLIVLAFVGVFLISVTDYSNLLKWGLGDIYALISAVFFSFGYVTRRWHSNLLNNQEITALTFFLGIFMLLFASFVSGEGVPTTGWGLGIGLAILGAGFFNVMNNYLSNYGFQKVEAILASNILTLESFFAVLLGFLFFREFPSLKELFGGLLIVLAVVLMNEVESTESKKTS
ncbi:hypothetical protein A2V49_01335 [candidate division WWE3 bacterium RBG_19FT_COMBO_34_6]|uniref:EamA domain-containing protein n=1 Tax=candidate division WWE3 bacterium RBG_19FT_COMBO_34_6 TaxID=1802612 RepID=A0A1F4UJS2_UNCKA|nr:MAG: hypothetical protein A2V49_01335 [candidate division WWE3 bacterium RBG_19FT_COMBO_34_6]